KRQPADPGCGFSTPTPVTDGTHVYTCYGTGIVVCYDLDGQRQWVRYFDVPQMTEYGRSASCVLVDGKLILSLSGVLALDAADGKTLWDAKDAEAAYYGTPVVVKIDDENVVVTPNGYVLRVSDGKILAASIGLTQYNSPVARDGVVYFGDVAVTAVKLPGKAAEGMKVRTLWEVELEGEIFSSPVWHAGLLYVVSNEGQLFAVDTEKGALAWKKEIPIPSAGGMSMQPANIYGSLALAGGKLYLANDSGHMLVVEPGREYKELSKNYIEEGSGASPVFDAKQLFLRGGEELYCIERQTVD
ncbi:MAG TPA: PQQ-binding-like beta-propeller repeat protein, partial [Planctomycetota bacterium]|nr:PQQ-binding-like beta-propeller repeat protein [Planctomycetota bacterium]